MPVPSLKNWRASLEKYCDELVERSDDFVTMSDRKSSTRTEIVLNVDNDQRLLFRLHLPSL
jgi:hypothetical protein